MMIPKIKKVILAFSLICGAVIIFSISCKKEEKPPGTVTDSDGNIYKTVKIGTQIWMAENLKTTRFNDGTAIPLITDTTAWANLSTPGYCWYSNDEATYKNLYGALYNGYTVSDSNLCPTGWHVPSREEWQQLRTFLGDSITGGGKLKETGTDHWLSPNKGAKNSNGFKALPAGFRYFHGSFASVLSFTCIWSSTGTGTDDQWYIGLYSGEASFMMDHRNKTYGFSVRCTKD
ncbi:MAG: hypothetical protein EPN88_12055 [Bacteroidetes bacterium]|nr:MAG: hypothetical protein EPN88_12055 [Bacteroidota bacterium]